MYGIVTDDQGRRLTSGNLAILIQPQLGGNSIMLSTQLGDINGQFSYVLRIPFESEISGRSLTPNVLKLTRTPTSYGRSQASLNGTTPLYYTPASSSSFKVSVANRGSYQEVNLSTTPSGDSDGDGLSDAWELKYFGNLNQGASEDPDGDHMPNLAEQRAGTDPTDINSLFAFIQVMRTDDQQLVLTWSSTLGVTYRILRSTDVTNGFSPIAERTGELYSTTFVESAPDGQATHFYRIQIP